MGVVLVNVTVLGAFWDIFVFVIVWDESPDAVTNMVLVKNSMCDVKIKMDTIDKQILSK